jgi:hypothetical protein
VPVVAALKSRRRVTRSLQLARYQRSSGGGDYDTTFSGPRSGALEAKIVGTHGILQMTLRQTGYDWRFVTVGGSIPDGASGTAACH